MMTRKDYVAVANILKEYKNEMTAEAHSNLVNDFADYMEKDNDRFQDMLFLKASGVEVLDIPYPPKPATSHVALA
jgi:hypothetical protein